MLSVLATVMLSQAAPDLAAQNAEQPEFKDVQDRELTLFPAAVQLNGQRTQHVGLAGAFTWHLHRHFGLTVLSVWNYHNRAHEPQADLTSQAARSAQATGTLLLEGAVLAGVEVAPLYFALEDGAAGGPHLALVLNAAAGAGPTRHQLLPASAAGPPTFGDTGWRFVAELGGGVRVRLAKHLSLRLEVKDLVYAARVSQVNGCEVKDLNTGGAVLNGCRISAFGPDDVMQAKALVSNATSEALNNVSLYAGASLDL